MLNASHLRDSRGSSPSLRPAFTITELLVVLLVIVIVFAALMPIVHRLRGEGGQAISAANLKAIGAAHATYAADFNDRQVGWIADDFALGGGSYLGYFSAIGCQSPLVLGAAADGSVWGAYVPCNGPGTGASINIYKPIGFGAAANDLHAHRLANAYAFNTYFDGRFYDEVFYAPNDTITYELASVAFDVDAGFVFGGPNGPVDPTTGASIFVFSSYSLSPAAMYAPEVLGRNPQTGAWYTDPDSLPRGYQAPTVSMCRYPDLKTRTIEHHWNLGQPGPVNPAYDDGITPYAFTNGIDAKPLTLFFDGRVAELPNTQVAADDAKVLEGTAGAVGVWTRDTPFGASGYLGAGTFDGFVSGHHVLTADGIFGRDILSTEAGGLASAPMVKPASPPRPGSIKSRSDSSSGPTFQPRRR